VSAPRHMRSDELDLDYSERAGFMTGKSAAIADWRHRKEVRDFGALVNRLRVLKWQRENAEKHHAKQLRGRRGRRRRCACGPRRPRPCLP
jgi:hypothetical protein